MNISRNWLKEFVDIEATDREYDEIMTIAGQRQRRAWTPRSKMSSSARCLDSARHENSDHMWVCIVDVGTEQPVRIVTRAQNVHEGNLAAVAQTRTSPAAWVFTKGKLRGVESCGMLCSFKELGLTQNNVPRVLGTACGF